MTHDTPGDTEEQRRWCKNCELSVVPSTSQGEPVCPACAVLLE